MPTITSLLWRPLGFCIAWLVATSLCGCSSSTPTPAPVDAPPMSASDLPHVHDDHDDHGHEHPETFTAAVTGLNQILDSIREAFAKGDEAAADGPVHEFGHYLEDLTELAAKSSLSDEQRAAVDGAVNELFKLFERVDAKLHGDEGVSYDEVSAEIDAAMATLNEAAGSTQ